MKSNTKMMLANLVIVSIFLIFMVVALRFERYSLQGRIMFECSHGGSIWKLVPPDRIQATKNVLFELTIFNTRLLDGPAIMVFATTLVCFIVTRTSSATAANVPGTKTE